MLFKELLKKYRKSEFNNQLYRIIVADEVDYFTMTNSNLNITNFDYENICEFAYNWVMNTKATANEIVDNIFICLKDGTLSVNDIADELNGLTDKCTDKLNRMF